MYPDTVSDPINLLHKQKWMKKNTQNTHNDSIIEVYWVLQTIQILSENETIFNADTLN